MISGADPRTTPRGAFRWIAPSTFGQESAIVASPHTPGEQPPSRPPEQTPRVVAVVVTYNRSELLRRTLAGIQGGRLRPAAMVVVDNASADDTAQVLAEWSGPVPMDVLRLEKNLGGAGGFAVGIDRALHRHSAQLVWVMDDDTEPTEETLSAAVRTWRDYAPAWEARPVFVASRVLWTDGREHPMNSMRERLLPGARRRRAAAAVGAKTIRSGSFVSLLMDAEAMRRTPLPRADYFIWNDDFEYSTRLARFRDAVWAPESVVLHHTTTFGTTDVDPGPRFFNDVRNKLWVFTRSQSLAPWEKAAYFGATARLWLRTFRNSSSWGPLARHGARGLLAALRPPRENAEVLRGIYDLRTHRLAGESGVVNQAQAEVEGDPQARGEASDDALTVLMPVYAGDRPEFLERAFASSTWEQTLPPQEMLVVVDGPIPQELDQTLEQAAATAREHGISVRILRNPEHRGLASVLNQGLREATHAIIARADADDVSHPQRYARQLPLLTREGWDVVGAAMRETDETAQSVEAVRTVVTDPAQIRRAARVRNPISHPTVLMRRDAALCLGGYEEIPAAEDYGLWARMIAAGCRVTNLPEPLVDYRAGAGAWTRRGGLGSLRREIALQRRLRARGLIGPLRCAGNVLIRGGYRLLPTSVRVGAYRRFIGRGSSGQKGRHSA